LDHMERISSISLKKGSIEAAEKIMATKAASCPPVVGDFTFWMLSHPDLAI
jgi:hypothetical protein